MGLRDEIIESEKALFDLCKWKIILVASLGSLALGLGIQSPSPAAPASHEYLLCLIPFVCLYVDVLGSHAILRILVIGGFLECGAGLNLKDTAFETEYEKFAEYARNLTPDLTKCGKQQRRNETFNAFSFEHLALHLSSFIFSLFVMGWGLFALRSAGHHGVLFIAAGLAGIVVSILAQSQYQRRLDAIVGLTLAKKTKKRGASTAATT